MKKSIFILTLLAAGAMPGFSAYAADEIKSIDLYKQEIELTRVALATQRKAVIAQNMKLSEEEASKFWPVYNAYRDKMKKVNDRRVEVITDYADRYNDDSLNDKNAIKLVDRYLKALQDQVKVKKSFVKKFKKVLTARKVARFYQIDNRLDQLLNLQIAKGVPLVE